MELTVAEKHSPQRQVEQQVQDTREETEDEGLIPALSTECTREMEANMGQGSGLRWWLGFRWQHKYFQMLLLSKVVCPFGN